MTATSPRTRYQALAESLLEDIRGGRLPVGARVPGELELAGRFGVSRHTVREALRRLESLGLIGRRPGRGTLVLNGRPQASYVQAVTQPEDLLQYPAGSRLRVRDTAEVTVGRTLARQFGCRAGERWLKLACLRDFADDQPPVCWTDLYLRPAHRDVVAAVGRRPGLVHELIEAQHGLRTERVEVDVRAGQLSATVCTALQAEAGSPSMNVVRRYLDAEGALIFVSLSEHPGDRFTYSLTLERGWQSGSGLVWGGK
ncbi:MAG: GntR family transcriptional regulator [Steroidobacteraceae bacterium]